MIQAVAEFHKKFGFDTLEQPGFLPPDKMKVRMNFLLEELLELGEASGFYLNAQCKFEEKPFTEMMATRNLHDAFDALLDLEYVTLGTANLMGFSAQCPGETRFAGWTIWNEGFTRVQQANMAKVRVDHASQSKRGTLFDVRKPEGWQPPSFDDLFEDK